MKINPSSSAPHPPAPAAAAATTSAAAAVAAAAPPATAATTTRPHPRPRPRYTRVSKVDRSPSASKKTASMCYVVDQNTKMAKRGRVSSSHSGKQETFLNYLHWDDISGARPEFDCMRRCLFKSLVKQDTVTSLRKAAHGLPYTAIFNKGDASRKRQVSTAPNQGQQVMEAIFEFLQTRALIATKWHSIKLARHASFLRSETGACQQTPHTDFEPIEFSKPIADHPETDISRPFAVIVALQDGTQLYFADAEGKLLPIVMSAGDVLVFAGDADHCGAEWTNEESRVSSQTLGDTNNYRLFSYVPSHYRPEFLVPWIVCPENRSLLHKVSTDTVTRLKLHDAFDPDMQLFDNDRFQKYL